MVQVKGVKAKCRNCGRDADANEFVLDSAFRMVVCPNCVKERKSKAMAADMQRKSAAEQAQSQKEASSGKPHDWDSDDEYLERASKTRNPNAVKAVRVDDERVKFKCPKCSYEIIYNTVKRIPARCPYCSMNISGMK